MKSFLENQIMGSQTVAITGHTRPDGDCVGSCMGLYNYIRENYPDISVDVYLEPIADSYKLVKCTEEIQQPGTEPKVYDLFICLDTSQKDRLTKGTEFYFDMAKATINVDHHISNASGCGDVNYCKPNASSASELVYELLEEKYMDAEIAKALYLGIVHDTGVFQYSNTTPDTLRIAAKLLAYGFDFSKLIDETFFEKTYVQNQVLGRALLESIRFMDGRCIFSSIDLKTMEFYKVVPKDLDGIVSQLRITKGVECAIFLYQTKTLEYKVSLRSNGKVDVAAIASYFGGGGHVRAAGCTMQGTVHDCVNNLSEQIEKQLIKAE